MKYVLHSSQVLKFLHVKFNRTIDFTRIIKEGCLNIFSQQNNPPNTLCLPTVYPKKYAHGFVVLCFVVVMQSFIMNSHEVFIHIHQGCFAGTGAIVRLPQCQWNKPDGYGKISQCITTTKHSKAKTVCIFLGIYCSLILLVPICPLSTGVFNWCWDCPIDSEVTQRIVIAWYNETKHTGKCIHRGHLFDLLKSYLGVNLVLIVPF